MQYKNEEVKLLKIKIVVVMALCVFLSAIVGIGSVSATDGVISSTTFTNVNLTNGEALHIPGGQIMEVKGIQDGKHVAMKFKWHDIYFNKSYILHISVNYIDLFNDSSTVDYYTYILENNENYPVRDIIIAPYMKLNANNTVTIEILPADDYYY